MVLSSHRLLNTQFRVETVKSCLLGMNSKSSLATQMTTWTCVRKRKRSLMGLLSSIYASEWSLLRNHFEMKFLNARSRQEAKKTCGSKSAWKSFQKRSDSHRYLTLPFALFLTAQTIYRTLNHFTMAVKNCLLKNSGCLPQTNSSLNRNLRINRFSLLETTSGYENSHLEYMEFR